MGYLKLVHKCTSSLKKNKEQWFCSYFMKIKKPGFYVRKIKETFSVLLVLKYKIQYVL